MCAKKGDDVEQPIMTDKEYRQRYGDIHLLDKVKSIEAKELSQIQNLDKQNLQKILYNSGVFHKSLKEALASFDTRLKELRHLMAKGDTEAAMKKYEELNHHVRWIEKHLENARKTVRHYYEIIRKIVEEEKYIKSLVSSGDSNNPNVVYLDQSTAMQETAKLEASVKNHLIHILHVLIALDELFKGELHTLVVRLHEQVRKTNSNVLDLKTVNDLFGQMNARFEQALKASYSIIPEIHDTEEEILQRDKIFDTVVNHCEKMKKKVQEQGKW